jgi:histidine ammonia-lyase
VHGAVRDVLGYVEHVLDREMNASTDNPLLLQTETGYECISGGNFHGALLGYAMDFLSVVLVDLGVLSERRSARLMDPALSYGLPPNLVGDEAGLHFGYGLVQANATALVGEMRILATPASSGSLPSKGNQEDHNSMGMGAVRKTAQILQYLRVVLGVELLCACQGISVIRERMEGLELGKGTGVLYAAVREHIPAMLQDRYVQADVERMEELVESGELLAVVKPIVHDQWMYEI